MCLWCRRCSRILGIRTPRVGHNDLSTGFAGRWSAACLKSTKAFARFSPAAPARRPPDKNYHHQGLHGAAATRRSIKRLASPVQQRPWPTAARTTGFPWVCKYMTPKGSSIFYWLVFFFRMNKGARAWAKKYRTEIAASSSSVLSTFAAFPLDFAKSRMQSYNTTLAGRPHHSHTDQARRCSMPSTIGVTVVYTRRPSPTSTTPWKAVRTSSLRSSV